jgi:hypothetical protein
MIAVVLGIIIFILAFFLIIVVVDAYFHPFMSAQIFGGKCDIKDSKSCREGLVCRADPKDSTKNICQAASTECPACADPAESKCNTLYPLTDSKCKAAFPEVCK